MRLQEISNHLHYCSTSIIRRIGRYRDLEFERWALLSNSNTIVFKVLSSLLL